MDASAQRAPQAKRIADRLGPTAMAVLVLAVCLGMTAWLWSGAQRDAVADVKTEFDHRAHELMASLDQRMAAHIQVLQGVQGLFASSVDVDRREFAAYVSMQKIEESFPGVQGIGYMKLVRRAELAAHVAAVRRDGLPNYSVRPEGDRPEYSPVVYLEPPVGNNQKVFGFDALSEPSRRACVERARDSGLPALSEKITLIQEAGRKAQSGFLLVLPVYRNGALSATLDQRREAIAGYVYAPVRTGDMMAGLGGERFADLAVQVYDGDIVNEANRMQDGRDGLPMLAQGLRTERSIGIAGHRWTVVISALPVFESRAKTEKPRTLAVAGVLTSALAAVLTWLLAHGRAKARANLQRSRQLTSDLAAGQQRLASLADSAQRAQAMMRNILDSTIDGILVDNGDRRLLASNQRFRVLWSIPPEMDLTGDDDAMLDHLLEQLMYPAPFLYSRSQQYEDDAEHRDLLRLKDGRFFEQITRSIELGNEKARLWSFRDITERKQTEQRERSHRHVLELLARGSSLSSILDAIVLGVETTNPGMLCSILLLDEQGNHLLVGAAPSLPEFFNEAVHGMEVGHGVGSCGTAVVTGARIIVEDIQVHPHWTEYRQVAARAGLASSWSEPIHGASGKILGTFAIYHREPHYPSPANVVLIEQASHLAGIAIEQGRAALALRAGEERFRSLYDNAPVALWEQDWSAVREAVSLLDDGGVDDVADYLKNHPDDVTRLAKLVRIVDLNGAAFNQVGAAETDQAVLTMAQIFDSSAMPQFIEAVAKLAGGAQLVTCESTYLRLDGTVRNNEVTMLVMPGHAYTLDFVIVSTIDITERKRMDAELLMLATTDFLTGLPNRREFMARLDDELARLQRQMDECAAVLMLDIDHFKRVNDEYGHAVGDAVLRHLAGLMRGGARKIDKLGRMGGEEFAILLPGANGDAALAYAERLRQGVANTPVDIDGKPLSITVSIGIASLNASDVNVDSALIRADKALYSAKEAGRNRVGNGLDVRVA